MVPRGRRRPALVRLDDDAADPGDPDEADDRRIGMVIVQDADWKRPELTDWLVPEFQGEGYGSEAVALAVDYAFRAYDAPAVGVGAFASNDASRGLLESLGFEEEGRRRQFTFVDVWKSFRDFRSPSERVAF